jgi:hypothetical protein
MNKIYLIVLATLLSATTMAQVAVGPKFGVNLTNIKYGQAVEDRFDEWDQPFKVGINVGLGFDFDINSAFSFYTELAFTQKGSAFEGEVKEGLLTTEEQRNITLNYIELPVLARLKLGGDSKFYINAGPTVGYWIGGKVKSTHTINGIPYNFGGKIKFRDENDIDSDNDYIYAREDVNRLEVGIAGGAGFLVNQFYLDLRYTLGLNSIYEDNYDPENSWKTNVLSVSIGFLLYDSED